MYYKNKYKKYYYSKEKAMTPQQIELIKATVPVLKEYGVTLTTRFYKRMLNGNPELRNVFNVAHQAKVSELLEITYLNLPYSSQINRFYPLILY